MQLKSENSSNRQLNARTRACPHLYKTFSFAMIDNDFALIGLVVHQYLQAYPIFMVKEIRLFYKRFIVLKDGLPYTYFIV